MDKFLEFLKTVQNDPAAKAQLKDMKDPQSGDEVVEGYSKIAKAMAYELTQDEIVEGLQSFVKEQQARTAKAENEVEKALLDEDDLENVSGGVSNPCRSSYDADDWCWLSDFCSSVIVIYEDNERVPLPTDQCSHGYSDLEDKV